MLFCCRKSRQTRAVCGLALSCWKIPPVTLINRTTWCCCISSRYIWALIATLSLTMAVRPLWRIPAHTITIPEPKRSCSRTQLAASALNNNMKRDSSEKIAVLHSARLHRICCWHHRRCSARWCVLRTFARRPSRRRRLITVWEEIRLSPGIWLAVEGAVLIYPEGAPTGCVGLGLMWSLSIGLTLVCLWWVLALSL